MELSKYLTKSNVLYLLGALFILYLHYNLVSKFQSLPSPIYGGDYYNGLGGVMHIFEGGNPLSSAQMSDEVPWVPWFYHLSVSLFSKLLGLDPMQGLILFSILIAVLVLVVIYLICLRFFGDLTFAPILALFYFASGFPIFKYSPFAAYLLVPAFVLCIYEFIRSPDMKRAILTALLLGLCALSNTQAFFISFLIFGASAIVFLLPLFITDFSALTTITISKEGMDKLKLWAGVFILGFLISLLFWYKPLFVYHGSTPNDIQNITVPDMHVSAYLWGGIIDLISAVLFPLKSGLGPLFSIIYLFGLYHLVSNRNELKEKFVLVLFVLWLLVIIHPAITVPLFNFHLVNFMMSDQIYPIVLMLTFYFGLISIDRKYGQGGNLSIVLLIAILLFSAYYLNSQWTRMQEKDQYLQHAINPLPPPIADLRAYLRSNTDVNDIILTDNEDGFMMNAVAGRKVLSYRRAHASPYIDMHQRMADQAVIVYGNNDLMRSQLLVKYHVKYLLWSNRWIPNEFQFDEQGKVAGFFDPLSVPNTPDYSRYWIANGVKFGNAKSSLDPAPREGAPIYDLLIATPYQMSLEPLSPDLYNHFTLEKTFSYGGTDYFRLYKIKEF
ncbi:hypothetical protein HY990_03345 [Candidatus Micrarchaeota archaeon]|nr:hypothetical protein [Candidatus Micrarchaeota archaeon]